MKTLTADPQRRDTCFIQSVPEVLMSARRSHARFAVPSPWNGVLRVWRDAVVGRHAEQELFAITRTAAVTGEELSLDLLSGEASVALTVRVLESRPVIVDGAVRHRVRLALPPVLVDDGESDGLVPHDDSSTPSPIREARAAAAGAD
jgi:hypothetical protein